jgi:alkylhydroperoxidase family enzyme
MVYGGNSSDMTAAIRSSFMVRAMKFAAIELTRPTLGKPMIAMAWLGFSCEYSWINMSFTMGFSGNDN